jgi:hypothetical protein
MKKFKFKSPYLKAHKIKSTTEAIRSYWLAVGEYLEYGIKQEGDLQ